MTPINLPVCTIGGFFSISRTRCSALSKKPSRVRIVPRICTVPLPPEWIATLPDWAAARVRLKWAHDSSLPAGARGQVAVVIVRTLAAEALAV